MISSEHLSRNHEAMIEQTTALIHDGMRYVQPLVTDIQRELELDGDYHRQATRQWQATIAEFANSALAEPVSTTRSLLYPLAATDISTALTFQTDVIITLDQRNPIAATIMSTPEHTRAYLKEKLIAGMNFGTMPISHLTWCADLCLAGLEPHQVRLTDIFYLPGESNEPQPRVTEWEYHLTDRAPVRHCNIALVDLLDTSSSAFRNMSGYIASLVYNTTCIGLDKASFHRAPAFIQAVLDKGILVTDTRLAQTGLTQELVGESRSQLEITWKRLNTAYRTLPLRWGYADTPSDIGVFGLNR